MYEMPSSPPRFPIMHWALYGLLSVITLGLYSVWTSFRLTQEVAKIDPSPAQKGMLYFSWLLGVIGVLATVVICYLYDEDGETGFLLFIGLAGRFGWTFILRGCLSHYFARTYQRHFLPNGFILLFCPVMGMLAKMNTLSSAPEVTYTEDPLYYYRAAINIHPALYVFMNILSLFMFGFYMNYIMAQACRPDTPAEEACIKQLWIILIVQLVVCMVYLCLMDIEADINAFDRTVSIFSLGLTFAWAYKFRQFMIDQSQRVYGYELKISRALVFFFPTIALLCAVRNAPREYELYQITRKTAAK